MDFFFFFLFKFELNPKYTKCNRTTCWTLLKEKVIFKFYYLKKWEVYIFFLFLFSFCFFFSLEKDINGGKVFAIARGAIVPTARLFCSTLLFKFRFDPGWICIFLPRKKSHHQDTILHCDRPKMYWPFWQINLINYSS